MRTYKDQKILQIKPQNKIYIFAYQFFQALLALLSLLWYPKTKSPLLLIVLPSLTTILAIITLSSNQSKFIFMILTLVSALITGKYVSMFADQKKQVNKQEKVVQQKNKQINQTPKQIIGNIFGQIIMAIVTVPIRVFVQLIIMIITHVIVWIFSLIFILIIVFSYLSIHLDNDEHYLDYIFMVLALMLTAILGIALYVKQQGKNKNQ